MARHFCKFPMAVFQFRQLHLIVPHCCWQCLLLQSTPEIAYIPGFCDIADNADLLVRHGKKFLQTSKGCFTVQTITHDRSALLLAVPTFSTVANWDCQYSRISGQRPLFSSTWKEISANFQRLFSSSDKHTWSFHTVFGSASFFYSRQLR